MATAQATASAQASKLSSSVGSAPWQAQPKNGKYNAQDLASANQTLQSGWGDLDRSLHKSPSKLSSPPPATAGAEVAAGANQRRCGFTAKSDAITSAAKITYASVNVQAGAWKNMILWIQCSRKLVS